MKKITLVCLALSLIAVSAMATGVDRYQDYNVADGTYQNNVYTSDNVSSAKSDTVYLLGGAGGTFQSNPVTPDDHGWYGVDLTAKTTAIWHVNTFNSPTGTPAAWCGGMFASCGGSDPPEGYGNGYEEYLDWTGTVANSGAACAVNVSFTLNYDNEPGYDYLYLIHETSTGWFSDATFNGTTWNGAAWVPVNYAGVINYAIGDYVGAGSNEVHLRLYGTSDGAWSDADCLWPTAGLAQVDDIVVSGDNGLPGTSDDFSAGLGNWSIAFPVSVGDFSKIWPQLGMTDPCAVNNTPQAAFIDDGVVVPCTGGTLGTTWTYGPGSYTHNLTGGCAGPTAHAQNEIWSPILAWEDELGNPIGATHAGGNLAYNSWSHLPLGNGFFRVWHVRSSADNGTTWTGWADRNFVYYGGETYLWISHNVTDLLTNTPTDAQVALGTYELGWVWGLVGTDGTPAPYFDNVIFRAYTIQGPSITTRELEMAQDNFPTNAAIDYVALGNNSIRFDMANDIMGDVAAAILPGDSITYDVTAVRPGSTLNQRPRMYYNIKTNSIFDPVRAGGFTASGFVLGDSIFTAAGALVPDRYSFDLEDTGWIFPGDVVHYYIWAEDNQAGDIAVATMPGDLSGYGVYPGDPGYVSMDWPSANIMRGLPSLFSATAGDQPGILLYNDFGSRGAENEWNFSLMNLGYFEGVDYDVYYTNAPSSGVSNGLGARATLDHISGYDSILYSFGSLSSFSLNTPDQFSDKSDDLGLIDAWLRTGNKDLLLTGDGIVTDLMNNQGTVGPQFVADWMDLNYVQADVSTLIGGQTAPLVIPVGGNSVGFSIQFYAYGSCPSLNQFDAVTVGGSAELIAEFSGSGAPYGYAAGSARLDATYGAKVVYFPIDFSYWYTVPGYVPPAGYGPIAARTQGLEDVLIYFGHLPSGAPTDVEDIQKFKVAGNYPNPFNPSTTFKFEMPRRGDVSIKIFNVRGELVRTMTPTLDAGVQTIEWNGTNDSGHPAASGVYFYQVDAFNTKVVKKMALVK